MIEVRFIKIERGVFVALDLYFHMSYSDSKKALVKKKLFTKHWRGVPAPKSAQNGAYLGEWEKKNVLATQPSHQSIFQF